MESGGLEKEGLIIEMESRIRSKRFLVLSANGTTQRVACRFAWPIGNINL